MPLALADSAREGSVQGSLSLFFSLTLFLKKELASSVRRRRHRRCSRAPSRPAALHLARAYGIAYWNEGRASAAITVLLPAGFCGCTSARSASHVPFLSGCNSPNASLFSQCCVQKCVINAIVRGLRKAVQIRYHWVFLYPLGYSSCLFGTFINDNDIFPLMFLKLFSICKTLFPQVRSTCLITTAQESMFHDYPLSIPSRRSIKWPPINIPPQGQGIAERRNCKSVRAELVFLSGGLTNVPSGGVRT